MSKGDSNINRWADTITPRDTSKPWTMGSGGSWDMQNVQPIPDEMLAELAHKYRHLGTPWNCRSLPLSPADREYMYLLYYSMQGLVARMRAAERKLEEAQRRAEQAEQAAMNAAQDIVRNYERAERMRVALEAARLPIEGLPAVEQDAEHLAEPRCYACGKIRCVCSDGADW